MGECQRSRLGIAIGGIAAYRGGLIDGPGELAAPTGVLASTEDEARALGCPAARLDTGPRMLPALSLYRSAGYEEIADYNGNPQAAYWMEKRL